ncbi:MAG: AAA family ATPase [Firmicutes bacterium ML8_F2]|jgi:DNA phosphorothioation-dependent restriction protein DptH|nr:MAG: AAA family ATPase [Firmicutes bacterium ML8_F2]
MNYLANTIVEYIARQAIGSESTLRFVLPSYPSDLLLRIGESLDEIFNQQTQRTSFKYWIAYRLGERWINSQDSEDVANLGVIRGKGWYNEGDNLTSLRNELKGPDYDCLVVLLAGYEHIDDQASLRDFFHLDQQTVWDICMGKSFNKWIEKALQNIANPEDSQADFNNMSELFEALLNCGLADILMISDYLDNSDFSNVMTSSDAYIQILDNLDDFKLPCMKGISRNEKKTAYQYINAALDFFNYSMFLEASTRKKYLNIISKFEEENDDGPDSDRIGLAKINDLKEYINSRSSDSAEKLKSADFVYILDQILNYKARNKGTGINPPPKIKKLTGVPPEVFLKAIWLTLNEFKKDEKANLVLVKDYVKKISIKSLEFKHDFRSGADDEDGGIYDFDKAKNFLITVIGGIDQFLENNVVIKIDDEIARREPINCDSELEPKEEDDIISYPKTYTAEPSLKFEVKITYEDNKYFRREFTWGLPQTHPCRLLYSLVKWAREEFIRQNDALPVYAVPYMAEIFKGRDEEEVLRLFNIAINDDKSTMIDLLNEPDHDINDPLRWPISDLSICYQNFLKDVWEKGFFSAMGGSYDDLRKKYVDVYKKYIIKNRNSVFGPILMKAFMFISNDETVQNGWYWRDYLQAAIVTPLHPALLEMIKHQHTYLSESMCYYAAQLFSETNLRVSVEKKWSHISDLSRMQWPIFGTLHDDAKTLDTNLRSLNYIHLVGELHDDTAFISTRFLMEPETEEDDDISDADLFKETGTSLLIKQQLDNYRSLYRFANDGLSIGAYCGKEIQPVIAAVDAFLADLLKDRGNRPYSLSLTIFSDSRDDSSVTNWINAWKDRWQTAELSSGKVHYEQCQISVSYRVITKESGYEQFNNLISNIDLDLMFFIEFISSHLSKFRMLGQACDQTVYRKFPILEKTVCIVTGGGHSYHRERVISNHRFKLGALHSEVLARIQNDFASNNPEQKHAVIRLYDYYPWEKLISTAHQQCTWVVCIDPAVDENLLSLGIDNIEKKREIIGFGSGVGAHGENNYTVSTEKYLMADINEKMSQQINNLLGPWPLDVCKQVADNLTIEAQKISGLSIVKATGPVRFVHELVANSIVRKILKEDNSGLCDEMISLDAFTHWFDNAEEGRRPDLLRFKAKIISGCFHIEAQIIECKLAQENDGFLQKARQQIESGLKQLISNFKPRTSTDPEGINDRPDQRYWWMQLHRLIASKCVVTNQQYQNVLTALERLSEGCFKISWQAAVVAIWNDNNTDSIECEPAWEFNFEDQTLLIEVVQAGKEFVKKAALEKVYCDIFNNNSAFEYEYLNCESSNTNINIEVGNGEFEVEGDSVQVSTNDLEPEKNPVIEDKIDIETVESVPERLSLGSFTVGSREVYWEYGHPELSNRHLLIFGASGEGKTYAVQTLLYELSKAGQNSLIVDYTNGFTSNQLEPFIKEQLKPEQHLVLQKPLPINPFRQQTDYVDGEPIAEKSASTAQRVSGVFAGVYQLGDQQKSALYRAVREGIETEKNSFNLNRLIRRLEAIQDEGLPSAGSAASVISKIQPFVDMNPFGEEDPNSWDRLYSDTNSRCHVIQLAGFIKDAARLITEFSLFDLYWYYRAKGSKDKPKIIVLDEIQNLDHRLNSPLGQFLTEGRKFGISLILATQTLSNLDKDQQDRLFQASHKLFFKPADTEVTFYAKLLANSTHKKVDEWVQNLTSLKRGECYSLGYALNRSTGKLESNHAYRIRIKALEERL